MEHKRCLQLNTFCFYYPALETETFSPLSQHKAVFCWLSWMPCNIKHNVFVQIKPGKHGIAIRAFVIRFHCAMKQLKGIN
eukprot:6183162-Ditylum_brightwellii.AAC.1